jgi:hypothetical protein
MLPFLKKSQNKMVSTLMDGRGNKTEVNGDIQAGDNTEDSGLHAACVKLLNAIERKSIPDMMAASKELHQECDKTEHQEGPHTSEAEDAAD